MAYTAAVIIQKGGVSKTTMVRNLGAALARADWRVLIVDACEQGNASAWCTHPPDGGFTVADLLLRARVERPHVTDVIRRAVGPDVSTGGGRIDLIPAGDALAGANQALTPLPGWDRRLRNLLAPLQPEYDLILIDTPPNAGALVVNAAVAADGILIPVTPERDAVDAKDRLLELLEEWREATQRPMPVLGIALSRIYGRRKLDRRIVAEIRDRHPGVVLETVIPDLVAVPCAYDRGEDVGAFDPSGEAASAYATLATEIAQRIGSNVSTMTAPTAVG